MHFAHNEDDPGSSPGRPTITKKYMNKIVLEKFEYINKTKYFRLIEGDEDIWRKATIKLSLSDGKNYYVPIGLEKEMNQMLRYYGIGYIEVV